MAQNAIGTITYGKRFNAIPFDVDTVTLSSVKNGLDGYNGRILESINDVEYTLSFSKDESVFKAVDKLGFGDELGYNLALSFIKGKGVNYLNLKEDVIIEQKELEGELYSITGKMSDICWSLHNETKIIGKYTCYKATTIYQTQIAQKKRIYHVAAWYVAELPIKHGPAGFGNLPGLILELTIDKVSFYVKDIKLNIVNKVKIKRPNGKIVTQQEYNDIQDKIAEEFFNKKW